MQSLTATTRGGLLGAGYVDQECIPTGDLAEGVAAAVALCDV